MRDGSDDRSVVWILGAGFSRALGGPLLADLFTYESAAFAAASYGAKLLPAFVRVAELYGIGAWGVSTTARDRTTDRKERLWEHAEDFLEKIDRAISGENALRAVLEEFLRNHSRNDPNPSDLESLRANAHHLLAAECGAFVREANPTDERWLPYLHWARNVVSPNDTIVTFNYDRVPDTLAKSARNLYVHMPAMDALLEDSAAVIKLHGSIDWRVDKRGNVRLGSDVLPERIGDEEIGVATPGPAKRARVGCTDFSSLWKIAENAIKSARAIVFLGYRFPPSDAYARGQMLDAIAANRNIAPPIHTVLGANVDSVDSRRLQGLISTTGKHNVVSHPMWAEDFIHRWGRREVFRD